jgi:ribosomal protein L34E
LLPLEEQATGYLEPSRCGIISASSLTPGHNLVNAMPDKKTITIVCSLCGDNFPYREDERPRTFKKSLRAATSRERTVQCPKCEKEITFELPEGYQ